MRAGLFVVVLGIGCQGGDAKVTREDCSRVADHIAQLVVTHYTADPKALFDDLKNTPESGIPPTTTRDTMAAFLESPEGKTWFTSWRGHVRTGTESGIERCMSDSKPADIKCLLAAKSRADVDACGKAAKDRK